MCVMEVWIDLFDKLPDEVLEVILEKLKAPPDLASVTKASSICANILHPKKSTYLFHEVVHKIAPYLSKSDLLNFRLVCTEWKSSTDSYLENSEMFNDEIYFRRNSPFWPRRSRSITSFLSTMQFHHDSSPKINPFPGRRAAFGRIRREAPDFDYWVHVVRLLNDFGDELWDCRLDFEDIPFDRFVTVLSDCLTHLPFLKRLQIVYFGRLSMSSDPCLHLTMRNIFPQLPFLKHLELNGTFPSIFYHSVIIPNFSISLKCLKLYHTLPEDVTIVSMPNLEVLRVSISSADELQRVLPGDSTSLRDVQISMYLTEQKDFMQLFDRLHFYRDTLKSLEISFDTMTANGNLTNLSQPLFIHTFPILNVLKLKNAPLELLHSIESFPSVENLEFQCLEKGEFFIPQPIIEQGETCGVFKICGYPANQLYNSNIWNLLPCLVQCRLSCYQLFSGRELNYKYSRARYEYLQRCAMC